MVNECSLKVKKKLISTEALLHVQIMYLQYISLLQSKVVKHTVSPGGQNQLSKDSNLASWMALENVKASIDFGLLTVFS